MVAYALSKKRCALQTCPNKAAGVAAPGIAVRVKEVRTMTVAAKMKGQLKETTGEPTGDSGMEAEGKFEQGDVVFGHPCGFF